MEKIEICEKVRITLSFAVKVLDDYTQKILNGTHLSIEGCSSFPIWKKEGFYLFVNVPLRQLVLKVEATNYITERISIDLDKMPGKYPLVKVYMKPSKSYALPDKTTCIEGKGRPYSNIKVFYNTNPNDYKLLYDYKKHRNPEEEKQICIYNPKNSDLEGKSFCIMDKEMKNMEEFRVQEVISQENNTYKMEEDLSLDYKKIGTRICPIFETKTDENGKFFLVIQDIEREDAMCRFLQFSQGDNGKIEKEVLIKAGKVNLLEI
ncbi:MAG: hypothetical protein RSB37_00600 [Acetivibrio sp.]